MAQVLFVLLLLQRTSTDATMNFLAGDIEAVVDSLIGMRHGSIEGPPLLIVIKQAALETMVSGRHQEGG